jgi:hypothetical protein
MVSDSNTDLIPCFSATAITSSTHPISSSSILACTIVIVSLPFKAVTRSVFSISITDSRCIDRYFARLSMPYGIQDAVAKLIASATLKPEEKPE